MLEKKKSAGDASLHSEPISRQHLQNHSTISRQHLQELEARARTHTMIHSVLRDWDVEDRKMKAWETEKECSYVCWRQW